MKRMPVILTVLAAATVGGATLGFTDAEPESRPMQDVEVVRGYLLEAFERQKRLDAAYARAMPDSAWRWAPTADVRDFAQQMAHATHEFFSPWRDDGGPSVDSAAYLNDREAMVAELEDGWDWAIRRYRDMTAAELTEEVEFFTGQTLPQWRYGTYWIEHAMWTRGSVVPYLRMHGVEPPTISFFTVE
jgi:hypothetical protein